MRDILSGLPDPVSDPDPVRRAQIQMQKPLPKRFYQSVTVAASEPPSDAGHLILLDGKPLRTPARRPLLVPTAQLAAALAAEWDAQQDVIDPRRMPLTRLVNTAIDGVADEPQAVAEDILRFAGTDLICYRAEGPQGLVDRQNAAWDPIIDWAHRALGARFVLAEGVMHVTQPREAILAVSIHMQRHASPLALAALHTITTLTGSALLSLAVADGQIDAETAWVAAHVDEDWNIHQWGEDAEAAARREKRWEDMRTAAFVLSAV